MHSQSDSSNTSKQLALSILAAMRVAGPHRDDGSPSRLSAAAVQRETGIARSTLRTLRQATSEAGANPDLHTLTRLADALGIPVAFLLMRPQDWDSLQRAVFEAPQHLAAANELRGSSAVVAGDLAENVLRRSGVHPEQPPIGDYGDKAELARMKARNEWRRRTCTVAAALMQQAARSRNSQIALTALAAAFANQSTPHDPLA